MKNVWAPWRIEYIRSEKPSSCVFCSAPKEGDGLILLRGHLCYSLMNRFPYNAGHCMIAPFRHVGDLTDLNTEESSEMMDMCKTLIAAIRSAMGAQGFNFGCNLGSAAGAGIADHLHLHIVPRWNGDTNFLPVLDGTHVISEYIQQTRDKIMRCLP